MNNSFRNKSLILFFLFSTIFSGLYAQLNLSETCSNLTYTSSFEKEGIDAYCKGNNIDFLHLAVGSDHNAGQKEFEVIKELLNDEIAHLKMHLPTLKKNPKKLKYIFDHVHQVFLKQEEVESNFTDIFATGRYNCLTASTLYAIILNELNQKFTIKFMPGHTYLLVYADNIPFLFETTDPANGFIEVTKIVEDQLLQNMRQSQNSFSARSAGENSENNFSTYFIKLNNTELNGLISYQYVNRGIKLINSQRYMEAVYCIEKANLFTPLDELTNYNIQILGTAIELSEHSSIERAVAAVKFYNLLKIPNKRKIITDDFKSVVYECLHGSFPAPDSIHSIYKVMMNGIKDEDVKAVMTEDYNQAYIYYLRSKAKSNTRFPILYEMYAAAKDKEYLISLLSQEINIISENISNFSDALVLYDSLAIHYPLVKELSIFKSNHCRFLINTAEETFRMKDITKAEQYLNRFEQTYTVNDTKELFTNPSGMYSLAASYYFKKGNTAKAKALLNKGLTYSPDNWELKKKLSELK